MNVANASDQNKNKTILSPPSSWGSRMSQLEKNHTMACNNRMFGMNLLLLNKINNSLIEILPKDTASNPEITLNKAKKLYEDGVRLIIGPVFNENLVF